MVLGSMRARLLAGGGLALIVVILIAAFALRSSGGPEDSRGFVFIDGVRLSSPYTIASEGAVVTINGTVATDFGGVQADEVATTPAASDDAFAIVTQVRQAYLDAGGGDAGERAALAMLGTHPAAPQVQETTDPREIQVTDRSGETGSFRIEVPDTAIRATSAEMRAARAEATAADWRALLDDGGGIVASTSGVVLALPPDRGQAFLLALDAAQAQSGTARDAALAALLEAPGLIADFGGTPPPLTPFAAAVAPGTLRPVSLRSAGGAERSAVATAAAGSAKTPGKAEAYTFSMAELNDSDTQPFINATIKEGYAVWSYRNPRDGFRAFTLTANTGALYIASHSSPRSVAVEHFANRAALNDELRSLRDRGVRAADRSWWAEEGGGGFWLDITRAGIERYWRGPQTIVHAASCSGESLFSSFNAREFFGYQPTTSCAIATPDTRELWGRLSGVIGAGAFRYAGLAFSSGHYSGGFRYHDGSPDDETALSPSVVRADLPSLLVGQEGAVVIGFDTEMNTSAPDGVISLLGCLEKTGPEVWQFGSVLSVPVRATSAGSATVTVSALLADSPARIKLDGNQDPADSGVAPNRDDWVGHGACQASATEPSSTATSGIAGGSPPTVTMLEARIAVPVTTFTVTAVDPDHPGDATALTYQWSMTGEQCGTPHVPWRQTGASVTWSHSSDAPDSCEHRGTDHDVTTTVIVTAGNGAAVSCSIKGTEDQQIPNPPCVPVP